MMSQPAAELCASCHGSGDLGTDNGPVVCPDCLGDGRQLDSLERVEWRLRDIERAHQDGPEPHGCDADMRWLVFELRRSREALVQVLSRCQEDGEGGGLAAEIRFLANRALGLYAPQPDRS